jgi:hypothetical protein
MTAAGFRKNAFPLAPRCVPFFSSGNQATAPGFRVWDHWRFRPERSRPKLRSYRASFAKSHGSRHYPRVRVRAKKVSNYLVDKFIPGELRGRNKVACGVPALQA